MKIFHKYKFVLMSEWVQFFMFTFYYNRIILFFDLLGKVFISRIVSIQSWFEHKMSKDGLKDLLTELQLTSSYLRVKDFTFFVLFVHSLDVIRLQKFVIKVLWGFRGSNLLNFTNLESFEVSKALDLASSRALRPWRVIWVNVLVKAFSRLWSLIWKSFKVWNSWRFWSLIPIEF